MSVVSLLRFPPIHQSDIGYHAWQPITAFNRLWGLVVCHSYGSHGMRVSFPVRQLMYSLSRSISHNVERLCCAQQLHMRNLVSSITGLVYASVWMLNV